MQILAVAPILKGQSTFQQSSAPAQQPSHPQQGQQYSSSSPQPQPQPQQQPGGHSDLINFGQAETVPASVVPERGSSLQEQHAPPGLQQPMIPGAPLKRVDTATNRVDEFVDAKP